MGEEAGAARTRLRAAWVAALAAALMLAPAGAQAAVGQAEDPGRGDTAAELRPPAPGEAAYPEDPSEPARPDAMFRAYPRAGYDLDGAGQRFPGQSLEVFAGSNRYLTSVATSRNGWEGGADAVVLASGEDYRDPLAAATLAGTIGGPLLLTAESYLEPGVGDELVRLRPEVVYVIGRLSADVEREVEARGLLTERIAGTGHHETAFAIAQRAMELGGDPSTALIASADGFADALSASAVAAAKGVPILFAPSTEDGRRWLLDRLAELGTEHTWIIGGSAAIDDASVAGVPDPQRLAGRERTETAVVVAEQAFGVGMTGRPVIAGSDTFADGLSGGVLAGAAHNAPVLLTPRQELYPLPARWLEATGHARVDVVGGTAAISALTRCQLGAGDTRAFLCVEQELHAQGYHTGNVDGRLDHVTIGALYAFQKVAGLPASGRFGQAEWSRMLQRPRIAAGRHDLPGDRVEINLGRQLILVIRGGDVRHVLHTSTGAPSTPTVRGVFHVYEKRNYRQSHNAMYRPVFFYRGYAFHGYPEVPLHPASHGCARMFDADMDFLWGFLPYGHTIATY